MNLRAKLRYFIEESCFYGTCYVFFTKTLYTDSSIDRYNLVREYQRLARENAVLNYAGIRTGIEEEVERMRAMQAEDTAVAAMKLEDLRRRVADARLRVLTGRQLLLADAENLRADLRRRVQGMMEDILRPNDRFL